LEGASLTTLLEKGTFEVMRSLVLTSQIAEAIQTAHAKDIVHRDLKPSNIFICVDNAIDCGERAKVMDFIMAKLTDSQGRSAMDTQAFDVIGQPEYVSPEQCQSAKDVDCRTDIYSLGCLLFEMLCGTPPFSDGATAQILAAKIMSAPPLPSSINSKIPPDVDKLILKMLAKSPVDRHQTMLEVCKHINELMSENDVPARRSKKSELWGELEAQKREKTGTASEETVDVGNEASDVGNEEMDVAGIRQPSELSVVSTKESPFFAFVRGIFRVLGKMLRILFPDATETKEK